MRLSSEAVSLRQLRATTGSKRNVWQIAIGTSCHTRAYYRRQQVRAETDRWSEKTWRQWEPSWPSPISSTRNPTWRVSTPICKDYLKSWLAPLGEVETSLRCHREVRELDVWFYTQHPKVRRCSAGLLGRLLGLVWTFPQCCHQSQIQLSKLFDVQAFTTSGQEENERVRERICLGYGFFLQPQCIADGFKTPWWR